MTAFSHADGDEYMPLRDVVFKTLRQAILRGELQPGERLMEIALSKKLGVSRTPIREAIRMLELEGLVLMIPRKGAEVAGITEKNLRDTLEVRRALEELAIELSCTKITDEELNELEQAEEEFVDSIENKDIIDIARADEKFHDIIFTSTGNDKLVQMINNLREQMYRYRLEYVKAEATRNQLMEEHEMILKALKSRDKSEAKRIIAEHINNQEVNVSKIFGGQSSEHEISVISATNISKQVDTDKYELILIGITKEGKWLKVENISSMEDGSWINSRTSAFILPDATKKCIIVETDGEYKEIHVDVVFPVLHGLYGEDGTIQGLLELAKIPYVGCGVLASAVGMDKLYTKLVVDKLGIRQAEYEPVLDYEARKDFEGVIKRIENRFDYPVFVKPSNAGSSRGVSKATNREELEKGIKEALNHDRKVLVEETIVGHEVECGVLGKPGDVMASGVGEIKSAATFYDYDAKYKLDSLTLLDSKLPDGVREKLPECAKKIFTALDGFGLSRVDFFAKEDGEIVFNEINTMPGFTAISMYPMLFEAAGIGKKELIDKLIDLAFERR